MVGRSRHLWTPETEEMDGDDVVMKNGYGYADRGGFPQYANPYPYATNQPSGNGWGNVWPESQHVRQNKEHDTTAERERNRRHYEQSLEVQNKWRDLEQTSQESILKAKLATEALEKQLRESELARQARERQDMENEQRARATKENMERMAQEREKIAQEHARFTAAKQAKLVQLAQQAQQALEEQQLRQNASISRSQPHAELPIEYVKYSDLVLPRVIRLNFQKSKYVEDTWQFVHLFVDDLDRLNPEYDFTHQQYEEIWAHCVRDCSRSGEFLLTLGFVNTLNEARAVIEDGARLIKETRALRNAIRKKNKFPTNGQRRKYDGGLGQAGVHTFRAAPQRQEKPIFNPPAAPKADRAPPKSNASAAPRTSVWNKEGTIVGHAAKEIGAENKGRAMLEKMGWSAGMGLGTENRGVLTQVPVVVKHSTLGLGMDPQQARRDNSWAKTQR